jgi:D-tagatose-1,6-bisphosphate aldolase subunit GatZ/KbaZ
LIDNLRRHTPPATLLSQYLPEQGAAVLAGQLAAEPLALVQHKIAARLAHYARACAHNNAPIHR